MDLQETPESWAAGSSCYRSTSGSKLADQSHYIRRGSHFQQKLGGIYRATKHIKSRNSLTQSGMTRNAVDFRMYIDGNGLGSKSPRCGNSSWMT